MSDERVAKLWGYVEGRASLTWLTWPELARLVVSMASDIGPQCATEETDGLPSVEAILRRAGAGERTAVRRYHVYTRGRTHPSHVSAYSWRDAFDEAKEEYGRDLVSVVAPDAAPPG